MENNKDKPYSLQDAILISKILDDYIPADGIGTEREKLRISLHQAISKATEELRKERDSLKIELSNYAYQIDRAKRDRDTAEQQVERLKESNKERLDALKDLAKWADQIYDDGEGKDDWIYLNRAKSLIQKSEGEIKK